MKIVDLDRERLKRGRGVGLKRLREDPVIFIEQMFGALTDWQRRALVMEMKRLSAKLDIPSDPIV